MGRLESCDICGQDISGEAVRAELSFGADAMCPTPMTMHKECHEKASAMWKPDEESVCVVDNLFPETQQYSAERTRAMGTEFEWPATQ
ncbi:MAG: hypothetical protein ACRDIU_05285 [Actinomycetota bacterium]